jgi:glycerol kinase
VSNSIVLVIDVGTTGTRAMMFDSQFHVAASAYRAYQNIYPGPMLVEQDPDVWFNAAAEVVRECMALKPTELELAAVIVTSQRATIIPVDKDGRVLRRAILWQDSRSIPQCNRISEIVGDTEIYKRTGLKVNPYFSLPKIMWMIEHEPDIYRETYKFLMVHDFIQLRLTGRFVTDHSHASRTMAYNLGRFWDSDIIKATGMDGGKLCDAVPSGQRFGEISASASALTGIPEGTPAFAGAGDQQFAAIGLGIVTSGKIEANTGTGSFVLSQLDKPVLDPQERILCSIAAVPDKWVFEAGMYTTGSVYRWFRDQMGSQEIALARERNVDPYTLLDEQAATAPIGSSGVLWLTHFTGSLAPYWNPYSKGVLFNLSLSTTRAEIIRAILEGIAIEVNKNISIMKEVSGSVQEVRIAGGAAKSHLFNQIQADVYGTRVATTNFTEATALGAAIMAAVTLGWYPTIENTVEKVVRTTTCYEPNPEAHVIYQKLSELHHGIYRALQENRIYEKAIENNRQIEGVVGAR